MIYRRYGKTEKQISAIGFGGMRFSAPEQIEKNAELVLHAHAKGMTCFDTAPGYCNDKSEEITGAALRQMKPGTFCVSTKCGSPDGKELRVSLERSLERLGVDRIDFFNIWCIKSAEDWESRKKGGLIPQNAQRFDFIRSAGDPDVVHAALRFILSNPAITSALVGFSSKEEIDQAVRVTETFRPISTERRDEIKKQIASNFDGFCTGCGYCLPCPQEIEIPKMMDAYNMRILNDSNPEHITNRLKYHWTIDSAAAEKCTRCGVCESKCTQHLPIMERLEEIVSAGQEVVAKAE